MARNNKPSRRRSRQRTIAYLLGACIWGSTAYVYAAGEREPTVAWTTSTENADGDPVVEDNLMVVTQFSAGPPLGSTLIRSVVESIDDRFVIVQYLPISRVLSDTELKTALQGVQLSILRTKPRMILSLDEDYMKFMPQYLQTQYKDKFFMANKGLASVGEPSCKLIDLIANRIYKPDAPVYILRDESASHIESSRALSACLRNKNHEVSYYSASTVADLKRNLFDIAKKEKGILVSLVDMVTDTEFNRPIRLDEVNKMIKSINKKHLDLGFVKANHNLSLVIVPMLGGLDAKEKTWSNMHTTPKLYVQVDRLDALGGSLVYKNMFSEISGVLKE